MGKQKRGFAFWFLIVFFVFNIIILAMAQLSLIRYEWGVALGQHYPVEQIGEGGVAMNLAFNIADVLQQIFCIVAIIGLFGKKLYGWVAAICMLAITIYWPLVFFAHNFLARGTSDFKIPADTLFAENIFMAVYVLIGALFLFNIVKKRNQFVEKF